jgi:LmbE family N-acetylglucosaminyl deacetylase
MLPDETVERALVVMAHPDDVDFGCAGTVASWSDAGIEVTYCIATNGDAGGFDREVPRSEIPAIRQAEQVAAAKELGVTDVVFLGHKDGELEPSLDVRRDISRHIRRVRPQRVLCQSPERNYLRLPSSHPDHMAAGEATLRAVYPDARNPFAYPQLLTDERLDAWAVPEVWIAGGPQPNHYTDVTEQFPRKLAALRAHVSQTAHMADLEGMLRGWMGANAKVAGLAEDRLAEAFQIVTVPV